MLHHTNVDRLLALWQGIHPEVWISQQNEPDFVNRDLTPFWKSANAFHRSTDTPVRDFAKFHATYPEFVGLENLSVAQRKARIQAKVDELYDPNNRRQGVPVIAAASAAAASAPAAAQAAVAAAPQAVLQARPAPQAATGAQATPAARPPAPVNPDSLSGLQRLDWFIRIRAKKYQLKQSFTVLFFVGQVPNDAAHYRSSPNLIGSHVEFVNSDPERCANCKDSANSITEGFIELDTALERLGHGAKTEQEIEKYLQDNLHWRIQRIDGTVVAAKDLDVLEVSVMSWDILDGDVNVLPVHHDITSHKDGGRKPGEKPYNL